MLLAGPLHPISVDGVWLSIIWIESRRETLAANADKTLNAFMAPDYDHGLLATFGHHDIAFHELADK